VDGRDKPGHDDEKGSRSTTVGLMTGASGRSKP
jgi:hypothetical protein